MSERRPTPPIEAKYQELVAQGFTQVEILAGFPRRGPAGFSPSFEEDSEQQPEPGEKMEGPSLDPSDKFYQVSGNQGPYRIELQNSAVYTNKVMDIIFLTVKAINLLDKILRNDRINDPSPPQLALTLITIGQTEARAEEAAGDLTENFERTMERHGALAAHVGIWGQALTVPFFKLIWTCLDFAGRLILLDQIWKWIMG